MARLTMTISALSPQLTLLHQLSSHSLTFGSTALASYSDYDTPYLATDEGGVGITYAQNLGDTRILFSLNRPVEVGAGEEVKGKQHVAVMSSDTMISPSTHLGFMAGQAI